jgi:hypothetical protein
LETFTGREVMAQVVLANINHPSNAFNAQSDAHESFDQLAWGIEAVEQPGGQVSCPIFSIDPTLRIPSQQYKYLFRAIRGYAETLRDRFDGEEIVFCNGRGGQMIDPPNPSFCNLKLALAHVMHASGASDLIAELYGDDDDDEAIVNQPVYLGGPFVSDDILFRRLHDRL